MARELCPVIEPLVSYLRCSLPLDSGDSGLCLPFLVEAGRLPQQDAGVLGWGECGVWGWLGWGECGVWGWRGGRGGRGIPLPLSGGGSAFSRLTLGVTEQGQQVPGTLVCAAVGGSCWSGSTGEGGEG